MILALRWGARFYPSTSNAMMAVPGTRKAVHALATLATLLEYADVEDYNTACMRAPKEVTAKLMALRPEDFA